MYLSNWQILRCREGYFICGNVYGNPEFKNGTRIASSLLERISLDDNRFVIKTLNSFYDAYFSEMTLIYPNDIDSAMTELAPESDLTLFHQLYDQIRAHAQYSSQTE